MEQLETKSREVNHKLVRVTRESGIPLLGLIFIGIVDRGTNLIQVRATTLCNMRCPFCSTSANDFKMHPTNYIVDLDYLIDYVREVVKYKEGDVEVFLDSVGEPMIYPDYAKLVQEIKKIQGVRKISTVTNGTFLSVNKVRELEKAGLDQINLSFHAFNPELSKKLFGMDNYNVEKVKESILEIKKTKIDLMLTPVYLPGLNDNEVEDIIKFCKDNNIKIGIQKYEIHKYGRKVKGVKAQNYYKFYNKIREWEKKFDMKLRVTAKDLNVYYKKRIPIAFEKGQKIMVNVKAPGWFGNEVIGVKDNRAITIFNSYNKPGDKIKVQIIENSNNLYLARKI